MPDRIHPERPPLDPTPAEAVFPGPGPDRPRLTGGAAYRGRPFADRNVTAPGPSPLKLAWEHKFLLLATILLGIGLGVASVVTTQPRYKAQMTLELVGFNQSFMGLNQVDPQAGTDAFSGSASNMQTQMRILTSRTLLARVSERLSLESVPAAAPRRDLFSRLRNRVPFQQKDALEAYRQAIAMAAATVYARGVGPTRLIQIECESTDPQVAAAFLDTLAAEHISQALAARTGATQRTSQWMEAQLEESKARLQTANEKLREFVQQSGLDFFPEQATLADTKMRQLQSDVSAIQADRIAKQARLEAAKGATVETLPDIVADAGLQNLKGQIMAVRREMAPLLATLTPEHFKVKRLQAQLTEAEQAFEREKIAVLRRLESEFGEAQRRERLLSSAYNSQTRAVGAQADKAAQYSALKRDVEMAQQIYNMLLQQSNQAAMVALVPTSNIRVVDQALATSVPTTPNPGRTIPMGGFAGAGIGFGFVWLREMLRQRSRAQRFELPGHTQPVLGLRELAVIPAMSRPGSDPAPRVRLPALPFRRKAEPVEPAFSPADLLITGQTATLQAESFRQALASLLAARTARGCGLYVVTSVGPGEGKTTVCANLAVATAQVGQRVLLIDADVRKPKLHHLFGLSNQTGLVDALGYGAPSPAASDGELGVPQFYQDSGVPGLSVMTAGRAPSELPGALFFSGRLAELIRSLEPQFDFILVDTAPALLFPDARLWGRLSEGVVLVVRAGQTSRESALGVTHQLLDDGVPLLGTVLNDFRPGEKDPGQNYYSYYAGTAPAVDTNR